MSFIVGFGIAEGQEIKDSVSGKIGITGYVETYYSYDLNSSERHNKPSFIYSHHRTNEFSVNMAMLSAKYRSEWVRSDLSMAVGSYMNANYVNEEGVWKNVYEANLGFKLMKKQNLWLDIGVLPSHIGGESAISINNISLTRSLSAENSPYFETGARLSYTSENGRLYISVLALNGWQRIQLPNTIRKLSFGEQIQYKPNESIILNSSLYIGDEGQDSTRLFHDFYAQLNLNQKLNILVNIDYGLQKQPSIDRTNIWWNTGIQSSYLINSRIKLNGRFEYFGDDDGVIFGQFENKGVNMYGYSGGIDFEIYKGLIFRTEFRKLKSSYSLIKYEEGNRRDFTSITTSLGYQF